MQLINTHLPSLLNIFAIIPKFAPILFLFFEQQIYPIKDAVFNVQPRTHL